MKTPSQPSPTNLSDELRDKINTELCRLWSKAQVSGYPVGSEDADNKIVESLRAIETMLDHHTKEAERRARIEGMKELATELKCYDWQLEDTINSNDVVCEQIDFSLAELAAAEQKRGV